MPTSDFHRSFSAQLGAAIQRFPEIPAEIVAYLGAIPKSLPPTIPNLENLEGIDSLDDLRDPSKHRQVVYQLARRLTAQTAPNHYSGEGIRAEVWDLVMLAIIMDALLATEVSAICRYLQIKTIAHPVIRLLDTPCLIDASAAALVHNMSGVQLFRKIGSLRSWDEIESEEIQRILSDKEEASDRRKLHPKQNSRGNITYQLTAEARAALALRAGNRGYRRVIQGKEWAVKRWPASGGYIELRLSWYGSAGLFGASATQLPLLWDALDPASQSVIDRKMRQLGTLADARSVADLILRHYGHSRTLPVRLSAKELRVLLGCEKDTRGNARVVGALESLRALDWSYQRTGVRSGYGIGTLIPRYDYSAGIYHIELSEFGMGCIHALDTEWKPNKRRQKTLKGQYIRSNTLAPYWERVHQFSSTQRALILWAESNITLNRDAISKRTEGTSDRGSLDGMDPRVYDARYCPLLPPGQFHCALGHFRKNPEVGYKLRTVAKAIGYQIPRGRPGQALARLARQCLGDLEAVVEAALGGLCAARCEGCWISRSEASKLAAHDIMDKMVWYLFVPANWREKARAEVEHYHADRLSCGESDMAIEVVTNPADSDSAPKVGLSMLRHRLRAARIGRGLNMRKAGEQLGVSAMMISRWERGPEQGGLDIPLERIPILEDWISDRDPKPSLP